MPAPLACPENLDCQIKQSHPKSAVLNAREKLLTWETLPAWRAALQAAGRKLVVTNGCFDLLHAGHVVYLEQARNLGDALLVGLNSDASVRALKGSGRPLNSEMDRAMVLAALQCVDAVCLFSETRATRFLALARPDIYAKGGDYTLATLAPEERQAVEITGGQIVLIAPVPGKSTTTLVEKIRRM
jgi:D-beta-D-heptose 7-phosphate kinase/D-beta-D-heptose 1-phosphate adenosyltransferase